MSFVRVTVVGNLGGDVETKFLENGTMVASFSIAAQGRKKTSPTVWFRVSAFGEVAERLVTMAEAGYIAKGRSLYVEGSLEQREYQVNGVNRTSLDVVMTDWQFLGGGQQTAQNGQQARDLDTAPF